MTYITRNIHHMNHGQAVSFVFYTTNSLLATCTFYINYYERCDNEFTHWDLQIISVKQTWQRRHAVISKYYATAGCFFSSPWTNLVVVGFQVLNLSISQTKPGIDWS